MTMRTMRILAGAIVLAAGAWVAQAGAAELKVLSAEAMKPALQDLAPTFEKQSGHKLKIDYSSAGDLEKKLADVDDYDVVIVDKKHSDSMVRSAKLVAGTVKNLASEKGSDVPFVASAPMLTEQPIAAKALVDFLGGAKAKEEYKAKGMQPS
jgi:ABC-type molybdate transport system substrate-binding protein